MSHKKQKIRQRAGDQLPGAGGGKGLESESLLGAGSPWGGRQFLNFLAPGTSFVEDHFSSLGRG